MPRKGDKIDISEKEWAKIKTEYITTEISYRKLADKYGMTYTRLQTKAHEQGWKEEREAYREKLVDKSVDLICEEQAEQIARAIRIGNTMLEKIEESLSQIDMIMCRTTTSKKSVVDDEEIGLCEQTVSTENYELKKVTVDRAGLKQLSSVLKDLREIGIFRSELDKKEQEARIKKLQKDASEEEVDTTITVTFMEDGYAN